jgi:hypothetical protein
VQKGETMNDYRQLPRKGPAAPKLIQDKFPQAYPMFWGPNQRILEDDVYVEPSGFIPNRLLSPPKVVRFIHDAHTDTPHHDDCVLVDFTHIDAFARPATPAYGERPWSLTGSAGTWYPDATAWFATTVSVVQRPDPDPGFGGTVPYDLAMPVSEALDQGFLEYWMFAIEFTWQTTSGYITSTQLYYSNSVPVIVWTSDRPHLLMNIECAGVPPGCPCTGGP